MYVTNLGLTYFQHKKSTSNFHAKAGHASCFFCAMSKQNLLQLIDNKKSEAIEATTA